MRDNRNPPVQVPSMAHVVEINNIEHLEQYRLAWNALLPRTARASFFHTYDWLRLYWKYFGEGKRLRVLVVQAAGSPIGIVPLVVQTERFHVGNVRVLNYPLNDWGMWYGPIGPNPSASMFMALRHLRDTPRDWDLLDLRWTDADRSDRSSTCRAIHAAGWQAERKPYQQSSLVTLSGTNWNEYLASLEKKWRHEIRRAGRMLRREGKVSFERHRPAGLGRGDGDPRWDMYRACLDISAHSWQARSQNGNTLSHPKVRDFLWECHEAAARLGMLDMALMKVDDRPAAFQYNYVYEGNVFGLRMGYDPSVSKHGLGKVLLSHMIEDSFARGDASIDMGIGDYSFKRRFRTDTTTSYRVSCYPLTAWRSQGVRLTRWVKDRLQNGEAKKSPTGKPLAPGL